jgi:hypothetical protein
LRVDNHPGGVTVATFDMSVATGGAVFVVWNEAKIGFAPNAFWAARYR